MPECQVAGIAIRQRDQRQRSGGQGDGRDEGGRGLGALQRVQHDLWEQHGQIGRSHLGQRGQQHTQRVGGVVPHEQGKDKSDISQKAVARLRFLHGRPPFVWLYFIIRWI